MNNNMVSKIWVGMSTTNIHSLQSRIQKHWQTADLNASNSKEKPSKTSNITYEYVILPLPNEKQTNKNKTNKQTTN